MRTLIVCAAIVALAYAPLASARQDAATTDDMATIWPAFQAAVAKGDRTGVAALMRFPLQGWDEGDLGTELTKDDLLAHYAKAFTPTVVHGIATGTPKRQDDGSYIVEWQAKAPNPHYTLVFE